MRGRKAYWQLSGLLVCSASSLKVRSKPLNPEAKAIVDESEAGNAVGSELHPEALWRFEVPEF